MGDEEPKDLVETVRRNYLTAPKQTKKALSIAMRDASLSFLERVGPSLNHNQKTELALALSGSADLAENVLEYIGSLDGLGVLTESSVSGHALYGLTAQLVAALRLSPGIVESETAQRIIVEALSLVNDLADASANDFYLGRDPIDGGKANQLIGEYFSAISFQPSFQELKGSPAPVHLILNDWGAAVRYCKGSGVAEDAFLRDGTDLFRFAPDALSYVQNQRDLFPGLVLRQVNNGSHVESWLTGAQIGLGQRAISTESWLVLLTGYTPDDNAAIPGLNKRYSSPLISTALDIQNRRL